MDLVSESIVSFDFILVLLQKLRFKITNRIIHRIYFDIIMFLDNQYFLANSHPNRVLVVGRMSYYYL